MQTGVTIFSVSRVDVESLRRAIKRSPTALADSAGISSTSLYQITNALRTIRNEGKAIRTVLDKREYNHMHVSLLCILPEYTLTQVILKADGLHVLSQGNFEGQHIILMSGTIADWLPAIYAWLERPTNTLREFATQVASALASLGIQTPYTTVKEDKLLYLGS